MDDIGYLKNKGHELLEEYIALDYSYRDPKAKIQYAYKKLGKKLTFSPHFAHMKDRNDVLKAMDALVMLIRKRKKKREIFGVDKNVFAPNLKELQKNARLSTDTP